METFVQTFESCLGSANLGTKHRCLIRLIQDILPILNQEIGEIGGAAIREILSEQERYRPKLESRWLPFSTESDNHNTYLYMVLAEAKDQDGTKYQIGIQAETPWHGDWDYLGWSGLESMPYDVRDLARDEVNLAAKRFLVALLILNKVFPNSEGHLGKILHAFEDSNLNNLLETSGQDLQTLVVR